MKKSYLSLIALLLTSLFSFAQQTSNFVIFSEDASLFYVIVNGIKQNIEPKSNVKITGLTNQANQILILFSEEKKGSLKKSIYFQEMGVEATAKITHTKKGYKLRYFGEVAISGNNTTPGQWTTTYQTAEPVAVSPVETTNWNSNTTTTNNPDNSINTSITTTNTNSTNNNTTNSNSTNTTNNTNSNTTWSNTDTQNTQTNTTATNTANTNVTPASTGAVDMNYIWTAGTSHTFSTVQTDDVSTSMMGMTMKDQFKTTSEFVLYISSVLPNGEANGTLYLIDYKVTDSRGAVLASINDLPKKAIQSEVKVDKKGKFTFVKKLMLITTVQGNVLAYAKADGTSLSVGGQAGDVQVDAYAEFDPKTGNLKAGYKTTEIKATHKVSVKVNEETDMIDVLPYDYLEMLELPEGAVAQGDKASMRAGLYSIDMTAASLANGTAKLNYKISTDKNQNMTTGNANATDGDGNVMFDMNTEGLGDVEMDAEDKNAMNMMSAMSPSMSGDITSDFSYALGMFQQVSGTLKTSMDAMGMKMDVVTNMTMKKL